MYHFRTDNSYISDYPYLSPRDYYIERVLKVLETIYQNLSAHLTAMMTMTTMRQIPTPMRAPTIGHTSVADASSVVFSPEKIDRVKCYYFFYGPDLYAYVTPFD